MWQYQKKLEYPINITKKDLRMAKYLVTQYGGSAGELAAALRYLNQRYTMPDDRGKALLTDIGTEELGHVEMLSTMIVLMSRKTGTTMKILKNCSRKDAGWILKIWRILMSRKNMEITGMTRI